MPHGRAPEHENSETPDHSDLPASRHSASMRSIGGKSTPDKQASRASTTGHPQRGDNDLGCNIESATANMLLAKSTTVPIAMDTRPQRRASTSKLNLVQDASGYMSSITGRARPAKGRSGERRPQRSVWYTHAFGYTSNGRQGRHCCRAYFGVHGKARPAKGCSGEQQPQR